MSRCTLLGKYERKAVGVLVVLDDDDAVLHVDGRLERDELLPELPALEAQASHTGIARAVGVDRAQEIDLADVRRKPGAGDQVVVTVEMLEGAGRRKALPDGQEPSPDVREGQVLGDVFRGQLIQIKLERIELTGAGFRVFQNNPAMLTVVVRQTRSARMHVRRLQTLQGGGIHEKKVPLFSVETSF